MPWRSPRLHALPRDSLLLPPLLLPRSVGFIGRVNDLAVAPKPTAVAEPKPKPAEEKPSSDYYTEFVTKFVEPAVKCSEEMGEQFAALVGTSIADRT